ncbi:MAG TPA: DUF2188 domain-containing protein [Thermoanaerobaculia bacterium]|nr:DUF2188 domain-containing protein [Thermoanaerobaculia bacterium]
MRNKESRSVKLADAMRQLMAKGNRQRVIHVIPDGGRWVVKRELARRATRVFSERGDAVDLARSLAKESSGEVVVHREDGTMQEWQVVNDGRLQTVYTYNESR